MKYKKIFIASDHAGFSLKKYFLEKLKHLPWHDLGPMNDSRVDYPDFAHKLVNQLVKDENFETKTIGVLICGSGQGMAMSANKNPQIRAALCETETLAELSRQHNDANLLCLGSRTLTHELAQKILNVFLNTEFEGGRHTQRVEKI